MSCQPISTGAANFEKTLLGAQGLSIVLKSNGDVTENLYKLEFIQETAQTRKNLLYW